MPTTAEVAALKTNYRRDVPIAFDERLAAERCVDVSELGIAGTNHYHSPSKPPYFVRVPGSIPDLLVRESVDAKLVAINATLATLGVELYLFDAWRPQAVQRYFHDVWFPEWLRKRHPELCGQALIDEVEKYWGAPTAGESSPSAHSTGGAVDLTLIYTDTRQPLFMGGIFDDLTENAWTDRFERMDLVSMSDEQARVDRRLLYWTMIEAGFANHPNEWWHYSWGDQLWAKLSHAPHAHYGACNPSGRPDL